MSRWVIVGLLLACACFARREPVPTGRLQELMAVRRGPEAVEGRRIGPGDVVDARVEGRTEASRAYTVSRKGTIRLPGAAEVTIAEKSDEEAAAEIARALGAVAQVRLVEVTGGEATIAGAVEQPGTLRLGSRGRTLLDALAVTGGLTEQASGRIRFTPASGEEPIEIAADDVLRGGKKGPGGLYLRAGDRIDVLSSDGEVPTSGPDPVAELGFATADVPGDDELRQLEEPSETVIARRAPEPTEPAPVEPPAPMMPREDPAEGERRLREIIEARAEAERARREMELERKRSEELSMRLAELEANRARPTPEPTWEPMPDPTPEPTWEPMPEPTPEPTRAPIPTIRPFPTAQPMPMPMRRPTRPPAPRVSSPSSRIAVIGRVRSPGAQRLGEGRTVTRAVLRAGLADGADVTRIEVRRDDGVRSSTILVNLVEVRAGRSPDLLLEAGDTIIVP